MSANDVNDVYRYEDEMRKAIQLSLSTYDSEHNEINDTDETNETNNEIDHDEHDDPDRNEYDESEELYFGNGFNDGFNNGFNKYEYVENIHGSNILDNQPNTFKINSGQHKIDTFINSEPVSANDNLLKQVLKKLNPFQKDIFGECIEKGYGGLSLPLGSGKTIISLLLALYFTRETVKPVLIVVSKSLVGSWEVEIKKFFGDSMTYEVILQNNIPGGMGMWKLKSDTNIILTTIDTLAACYSNNLVHDKFIYQKYDDKRNAYVTYYKSPRTPFLNHVIGGGIFYSIEWGCLIVDEVQKYTNIETIRCQALGSINSNHRWLLSGTMFDEPKINRILGYYIILNMADKPRNMPDTKTLITSDKFKGLSETLINRTENVVFIPPKVNDVIVKHKLSKEEEKIYVTMKTILVEIQKKADLAKLYDNVEEFKKFNSYKLVMILYLRQALVCPIIPITSLALSASNIKKKSELSTIIMEELNKLGLNEWLNDEDSIKSSRLDETMKCIDKHRDEKVIVFSCFKSFLDISEYLINKEIKNRKLFRMKSSMSSKTRAQLIKDFEASDDGILLLTYQLGAEGLNLQFASTVLLVDFWWNAAKEQQAIGRIFRYGQVASQINVYFFTANTGIEKILFEKQKAKLKVLNELKTGKMETKIPFVKLEEIIKIISLSDNETLLKGVKYI